MVGIFEGSRTHVNTLYYLINMVLLVLGGKRI
jgi:hypothetical protein